LFCAKATISSPAQTFTTLATFYGLNGNFPAASFLQGTDGNFYGTTYSGGNYIFCGSYYCGTVFKVTAQGTLTSLHSFEGTDGLQSLDALVQATDGNFYGTTKIGGNNSGGTVFKITVQGTLTKLSNFCSLSGCADGLEPVAGLVQGVDGNLYGTTEAGGDQGGTVFKITLSGALTTLHSFDATDGEFPYAGLVQAADGSFYGTTSGGGAYANGTVLKITPGGVLTTLYNFCPAGFPCADGTASFAGLVQATDGNFYGTTTDGGVNGSGAVFKITPSGTLTTLYSFCAQPNCPDGSQPYGRLVQATDGNFYGTTFGGGPVPWARSSKSLQGACWPRCTASNLPMATTFGQGWCKPPTGTSTGQPSGAGRTTMAPSTKLLPGVSGYFAP
jgi:uncharacterized repeat protein (TIGR03803 family)